MLVARRWDAAVATSRQRRRGEDRRRGMRGGVCFRWHGHMYIHLGGLRFAFFCFEGDCDIGVFLVENLGLRTWLRFQGGVIDTAARVNIPCALVPCLTFSQTPNRGRAKRTKRGVKVKTDQIHSRHFSRIHTVARCGRRGSGLADRQLLAFSMTP